MDRQTLRDWVHRYNETGLEGLKNRANPGAPRRKLSSEQEQLVAAWVRQGPDPGRHQVVRWRLIDLRDEIAAKFGVALHERSVGKLLARLNFRHISARPRHPAQDGAAQEAHKKTRPPPLRCRYPKTRSRKADRALVARRSQGWPARQPDLRLGRDGKPSAQATRSAL